MKTIHLVGGGALGSNLALEMAKRARASGNAIELHLHDFDKVDASRNVASQNFDPGDDGDFKGEVIARKLKDYQPNLTVLPRNHRITKANYQEAFVKGRDTVIIDAVDNLDTRLLLWDAGNKLDVPVLHLGIDPSGTGIVSWNHREYDSYHLSPANLSEKAMKEVREGPAPPSLPPCELSGLRSLVMNTAAAGNASLFLYLGDDYLGVFVGDISDTSGIMTVWNTGRRHFEVAKKLSGYVEKG